MAPGSNGILSRLSWGKILGALGSALIGALVVVGGWALDATKQRAAEKLAEAAWRRDLKHQLQLIDLQLRAQVKQMVDITQQDLDRHTRLRNLLMEIEKRLVERDNALHERAKRMEDHLFPFRGFGPPPPP